ncbi:MAG TPA: ATP-binding protein, partial [Chitinophagaceae bacterium]|nr:ATP-binding protein [Chitinophagaceae bacterium]
MSILKKKRLAIANIVYWFLLVYIVVLLAYWFIALQQQNRNMINYKLMELKADDPAYMHKVEELMAEEKRKMAQYIGEGSTFLLVILLGAVFVYRSVRKQIRLSQQQQHFMMAVTHELKTPIAVAKLNMETVQKHQLDPEKQQKLLKMTLLEINRLDTLANNILISSQLEAGGYTLTKEELDLSSLAASALQSFKHRFPERGWQIETEDDLVITGDTLLLQILINNLLENAVKYSPSTGTITLKARSNKNKIEVSILDEGPGIPDEEKQRIFDRFYRIGNEAQRKTKGTGLGLYLCRKIASDHNATISVTNNSPQG